MTRLLMCLTFLCSATAYSADTKAVRLDVAADGSAHFRSIQAALDDQSPRQTVPLIITVKNGLYQEQVFIRRSRVSIVGQDKDRTRIVFPVLREAWRASHQGSDWGAGVVNIDTGVADITLANLTIYNDEGGLYGNYNTHQFAIRGAGTRIMLLHCAVISDGGDALSLWNREEGMYYHADCDFEGWVDYVCPRGWCYITTSRFFGHNTESASLWHDGSAERRQKLVIRDSRFDGCAGFPLGRNHRDGQVYLVNCRFSANMADRPFYRPPSSQTPWVWGDRHYFFNCHRDGGDYSWFADNLSSADGSPGERDVTARWAFDGRWDPEAQPPSILPYASFPVPKQNSLVKGSASTVLRWTPGLDAVAHSVYFGAADPPPHVATQQTDSLLLAGLQAGVRYYWRVDELTPSDTIRGAQWNFSLSN